MKQFNTFLMAVICMCSYQLSSAQSGTLCDGNKGPNLLGARGTFSVPFITVNTSADACLQSGSNTYNPTGNVGNKLDGCANPTSDIFPCSDYNYTAVSKGMQPEFTYSLFKVMGDANGSNCIHSPIWTAKDHTGDGGYFMAVNGAPTVGYSPVFYQIKSIPVCVGATYEFSAWVINMMPGTGVDNASPNISFVVNGTDTIGKSGFIARGAGWVKVGGSFVASSSVVDLQVINSTAVAGGNDLGLDDISINVCQSRIVVSNGEGTSNATTCEGTTATPVFTVSDPIGSNTYYKWQVSRDGSVTFNNLSTGRLTYTNGTAVLSYPITNVTQDLAGVNANGNIYRLVVANSTANLLKPDCIFFNDYTLRVAACGPTPVKLVSFNGTYASGIATLDWQTSQELNNDRFELFRSTDGNDFELAATIAGAGNSFVSKNYSYQDHIVPAGNNVFYKLKQIDKDGKFTFSSIVKLSVNSSKASFQLFPNPAVDNFTASFSAPRTATATLMIRNTNGQTVYSKTVNVIKGNNAVVVTNAPLKSGMYYVTIVNDDINYNGKLQKR